MRRISEDEAFDSLPFEEWFSRMHPGEPIPSEFEPVKPEGVMQ